MLFFKYLFWGNIANCFVSIAVIIQINIVKYTLIKTVVLVSHFVAIRGPKNVLNAQTRYPWFSLTL
jgi:hypothetical protein